MYCRWPLLRWGLSGIQPKGGTTSDSTALVLAASTGDNPPVRGLEKLGHTEGTTRKVWYSATVIHYTGNGTWTVGFAPTPVNVKLNAPTRWEWIEGLTTEQAVSSLGRVSNHGIVRTTNEEVRQILRGCP